MVSRAAALFVFSVPWAALAANLTVTSLADSGAGSLRDVLTLVAGNGEADTVTFATSGTIALSTTLPVLGAECAASPCLTIDGSSRVVVLDGNGIFDPSDAWGMRVVGPGVEIVGITFNGFEQGGVLIDGSAAVGATVRGCQFGNVVDSANVTTASVLGVGIRIDSGASGALIVENVISGVSPTADANDLGIGVYLDGADGNVLVGNIIGLGADGDSPMGGSGAQRDVGVYLVSGADDNYVGTDPARPNVIAHQRSAGLRINACSDNFVLNNRIGTDITGQKGRGNGFDDVSSGAGVRVYGWGNSIGIPDNGNLISGNHEAQVRVSGTDNRVEANVLGPALGSPTHPLDPETGNHTGVRVSSGSGNVVGGNEIGYHAANGLEFWDGIGVYVSGATTAGTTVAHNTIGYVLDGGMVITGSASNRMGILVFAGADGTVVDGNRIGNSRYVGIGIVGADSNVLVGNILENNGFEQSPPVEICLANSNLDCTQHVGDPPGNRGNLGTQPPTFDATEFWGAANGDVFVSGTTPGPGRVELFKVADPPSTSGYGGARETFGEHLVPVSSFSRSVSFAPGVDDWVTGIYTDNDGNSSEFAANARVRFGDPNPPGDPSSPGDPSPPGDPSSPGDPNPPGDLESGDAVAGDAGDPVGDPAAGDPFEPAGDGFVAHGDVRRPVGPPCSFGFERENGLCQRKTGCAAAAAPWPALVLVFRRRRARL